MKNYVLEFMMLHGGMPILRGSICVAADSFESAATEAAEKLRDNTPADGRPVILEIELRRIQFDITPSVILARQ